LIDKKLFILYIKDMTKEAGVIASFQSRARGVLRATGELFQNPVFTRRQKSQPEQEKKNPLIGQVTEFALSLFEQHPKFVEKHNDVTVINLESRVDEGGPVEIKIIHNPEDDIVRIFVSDPHPKYPGDKDKKWETYDFKSGYFFVNSMRRHTSEGRILLDWDENVSFIKQDKLERLPSLLETANPVKRLIEPVEEKDERLAAWRRVNNACLGVVESANGGVLYQGGPVRRAILFEEDTAKLGFLGVKTPSSVNMWDIIERDDSGCVYEIVSDRYSGISFEIKKSGTVVTKELFKGIKTTTHVFNIPEMNAFAEAIEKRAEAF
jgi:hypothetical protein